MFKFFFHIAYKGNRYHGWQFQPNVVTVQEVIEKALGQILKTKISVMGCGRTDAQVHATQFFFHIEIEKEWDFDLLFRLNKLLPPDVAVYEIFPVAESSHARYGATQRTYDYFIHTYKNPFLSEVSSLYLERDLQLDKMKEVVPLLIGKKDYKAFCKGPTKYKHTICDVSSAHLFKDAKGNRIRFQISANRFLSSMVRTMVGTLLETGRGNFTAEQLEQCILARQLPEFITPAYPQGLYLSKVVYPFLDVPPRTDHSTSMQMPEEEWIEV